MKKLEKLDCLNKYGGLTFSSAEIKATFGGTTNEYEEWNLATDGGNDTERSLYRDGELRCQEIMYSCK